MAKDEIERALQPVPLCIDPGLLRELVWASKLAEGDRGLARLLLACAENERPSLKLNAIGARKRCSRRYPLAVPAALPEFMLGSRITDDWTYDGAVSVKNRGGLPKARYLANIPRSVRPAFSAPPGHLLIDFDIRSAHPAIAAAISDDTALRAAVQDGIHAATGALFAPDLDPEAQEGLGKRCNSALLAGCGPDGLLQQFNAAGLRSSLAEAEAARLAWWAQFPVLTEFVRAWLAFLGDLRRAKMHLRLYTGRRSIAYYESSFLRGKVWDAAQDGVAYEGVGGIKRAERSSWTGILRGIESLLMDRIFMEAHHLGLRLAMPLYDGALWVAPEDQAHALADALKIAADRVLREAGIPTEGKIDVRRTWG